MITFKAIRMISNAILIQAVNDYRAALAKNDKRAIAECERFFRSGWYMNFTNYDGEVLMERLKKEAAEGKGKKKIILDITSVDW